MRREVLLGCVSLVGTLLISPLWGQSALDQLEERLNQKNPTAKVPNVPAVPGLPTPAGNNTLPPPPDVAPPGGVVEVEVGQQPGYLGVVVEGAEGERPKVTVVRQGSPAAVAGLRIGDQVVSIDAQRIATLEDIDAVLENVVAGQTLKIIVDREGKEMSFAVKLTPRTTRPAAPEDVPPATAPNRAPVGQAIMGRASLGISVANLTATTQQRFNLPVQRGALITSVTPGSAGEQAGLPIGGAIVAIDGKLIETADAVVSLIKEAKPGQEVELTYYNADKLNRKTIRLGTAADSILVPAAEADPAIPPPPKPGIVFGGNNGDRPLLRTLEKVIEGATAGSGPLVIRPGVGAAPNAAPPVAAADSAAEIARLQAQVRSLQDQLDRMEELVRKLEARAARP
jgi:hypothetical protein